MQENPGQVNAVYCGTIEANNCFGGFEIYQRVPCEGEGGMCCAPVALHAVTHETPSQ